MNQSSVDKIVHAVLYEGYILYPYRPSVKNHHRWTFGGLFPSVWSDLHRTGDSSALAAECLVVGTPSSQLEIKLGFLHFVDRTVARPLHAIAVEQEQEFETVEKLEVDGKPYRAWQEATERIVTAAARTLTELMDHPLTQEFGAPASRDVETLADSNRAIVGMLVREQQAVRGEIHVSATQIRQNIFKVTVRASNQTPLDDPMGVKREQAILHSLISSHAILTVREGQFVSLTDPPADLKQAANDCVNAGVWPVLVGESPDKSTMLASPIILYDYPQIAPESPGDLFDGTEIDEILTLRVMTLTDEEKRDAISIDPRAADLLKRTESLAREQLMNLHGTMRNTEKMPEGDIFPTWDVLENRPKLPSFSAGGTELHPGDRVRLRPRGRADAFDILLAGKTAVIASIEQDYDNRIHLAVTVEDDPGADLGASGKPGHRFFFRPDEVEPLSSGTGFQPV